jgi:hypothetical protein
MPGPDGVDHVRTERLIGRRPEPDDADGYVRFHPDQWNRGYATEIAWAG